MDTIEKALRKHQQKFNEEFIARDKQSSADLPEPDLSDIDKAIGDDSVVAEAREGESHHVGLADEEKENRRVEIQFDRLAKLGVIVPSEDRSLTKEQFRQIKRPLLNKAFGKHAEKVPNGNLIMVTSSSPGEGKTYNAVNLAMSIALEKERNVLLVDADVLNPSVNNLLGIKTEEGLIDYLSDDINDVADILYKSNIENLSIIPTGKRHHLTNELLASDNMSNLMHEMANRYQDRIIIVDTPPLLHTTEASILARLAGQIVLVVEEGKTHQQTVKDALSLLDPSMHIGLVLNKSKYNQDGNYYGYYG
ncbi:XrtA-associated tyrosine autokinase [Spartinivicinus ruber]|uniref:XrtA-associated tyrosine autokinase n=1 Tax=Spartinivicinus ruber TaxID=2683272 RepID=UPI0013CFC7FA|nr:XrtA-associated tyrosine autokinase [Spartinivicinus ruber]